MQRLNFRRPKRVPTALSLDVNTTQHGSCPVCHHFHDGIQVNLHFSRDRSFQNNIQCGNCGHVFMALGGLGPRESLMSQWTIPTYKRITDRLFPRRSRDLEPATDVASGLRSSSFIGTSVGSPIVASHSHEHGRASFSHPDAHSDSVHDKPTTATGEEDPDPAVVEQEQAEPGPKDQPQRPNINVVGSAAAAAKVRRMDAKTMKGKAIRKIHLWLQRVRRFGHLRALPDSRSDVPEIVEPQTSPNERPRWCEHCTARHKEIRDGKTELAREQAPCNCSLNCPCNQNPGGLRTSAVPSHALGQILAGGRTPRQDSATPFQRGSTDHDQIGEDVALSGTWTHQGEGQSVHSINGMSFAIDDATESPRPSTPPDTHEGPPLLRVETNSSFQQEDEGGDSAIDMTTPA